MKYAFNISDLHKYVNDPEYKIMIQHMIFPILDRDDTFFVDKSVLDENGVMVKAEVAENEERMGAIITLVRDGLGNRKGLHKNEFRIYQSKTGKGWKRV